MFLKGPEEITKATEEIKRRGLVQNFVCPPKDWDLLLILDRLEDGDILDMGCQGSVILANALAMGLNGRKVGIDIVPIGTPPGTEMIVCNLMNTRFQNNSFDFITCISVIEHGIDIRKFFAESSRLLRKGGKLFVSFDYWEPKLQTRGIKVFNLPWMIYCKEEVMQMIQIAKGHGLATYPDVDWAIDKPVIYPGQFSPCEHSYTFGFLEFKKI